MNDPSSKLQAGQIWMTIDDELAFQSDRDPPNSYRISSSYSFVRLAEGTRLLLEREIEPSDRIVNPEDGQYICTLPAVWRAHCWNSPGIVVSRDLLKHARLQE